MSYTDWRGGPGEKQRAARARLRGYRRQCQQAKRPAALPSLEPGLGVAADDPAAGGGVSSISQAV